MRVLVSMFHKNMPHRLKLESDMIRYKCGLKYAIIKILSAVKVLNFTIFNSNKSNPSNPLLLGNFWGKDYTLFWKRMSQHDYHFILINAAPIHVFISLDCSAGYDLVPLVMVGWAHCKELWESSIGRVRFAQWLSHNSPLVNCPTILKYNITGMKWFLLTFSPHNSIKLVFSRQVRKY